MAMQRIVSLALGLSLLFLNGAAASRFCACLDALAKAACCEKQMPCCDGGKCKMHPDASSMPDMALDLFKSLDAVASMPLLPLSVPSVTVTKFAPTEAPLDTMVRGPDCAFHALRAPPVQA